MFHIILSVLKVLFRNGETIVDLVQQIIVEVKGKSEIEEDLKDLESRTIPETEV